jgi:hypothetical protein
MMDRLVMSRGELFLSLSGGRALIVSKWVVGASRSTEEWTEAREAKTYPS